MSVSATQGGHNNHTFLGQVHAEVIKLACHIRPTRRRFRSCQIRAGAVNAEFWNAE